MLVLRIREIANTNVLAGATNGKLALGELIARLPKAEIPKVIILDFSGVEVATGSFLREAVLAFRDYCRINRSNLYPVVANLSCEVAEELEFVLNDLGQALVICAYTDSLLNKGRIIGILDEKQRIALNAVSEFGQADAGQLQKKYNEHENISITGWNNRLAALSLKGILMEFKSGRSKVYRPIVEGLEHGG